MEVEILKRLALMGAVKGQVSLSSTRLGSSIGMSPQTAARRLVHLEKQGYIKRTVTPEGQDIRLTDRGVSRLKAEFLDYRKIFEGGQGQHFRAASRPGSARASTTYRWTATGNSSGESWASSPIPAR